jgi:hypothetical protein
MRQIIARRPALDCTLTDPVEDGLRFTHLPLAARHSKNPRADVGRQQGAETNNKPLNAWRQIATRIQVVTTARLAIVASLRSPQRKALLVPLFLASPSLHWQSNQRRMSG